jgi:glyoxylase-like metal-dependent hydrolase (beta-lactamase superfamily II)
MDITFGRKRSIVRVCAALAVRRGLKASNRTHLKVPLMSGTWTSLHTPFGSIRTFTAPEDGWSVTSHIIELSSQLIVIDAQYTVPLAREVLRCAEAFNKPMTRLYITHYHPDHLLGAVAFDAPTYALRAVSEKIAAKGDRIAREEHEKVGADIPDRARKIDFEIEAGEDSIDGVRLIYRHLRQSETEDALTIELPDANAIIVQDLVYNNAHVFLGERRFVGWQAALKEYSSLSFGNVLPGHGIPGGPELYHQMVDYLAFAETALATSQDSTDFKRQLLDRFPDHGARKIVDHQMRFLFPS